MQRQINYKTMRVVVGVIAILLAPAVFLLSGSLNLKSISAYYWSDSRDVFVGALVAVGFFLSAYNGMGKKRDLEFYLSKIACICAIGVAFFPTGCYEPAICSNAPSWVQYLASILKLKVSVIHYISAIVFFICLIVMMWFFSKRAYSKGSVRRALLYRAIVLAMVFGIVFIFIVGKALKWEYFALLIEVWGLSLFGVGWLVAGLYKSS